MTLIDTQNVLYAENGRPYIPSSRERIRTAEGASRPSGVSRFRSALPSPTERVLIATIGRPWV